MNPFRGIEVLLWAGMIFIALLILAAPFGLWWLWNHVTVVVR